MYRRIGWLAIIGVAVFGFGAVISGPGTVDPLLRNMLGLQPPEPVEPTPVPGAEVVADRVKREITEAEVRALMATFTQYKSRVPGYPGHDDAAKFIEQRFRALDLKNVETETYGVTSPVDEGSQLTILSSGEVYPLSGLWPNLVKTSTLPPGGVRTRLIDGGDGEFKAYDGKNVENTVVLLNFNTWNKWLNAAVLGAQQIIFIAPDTTSYTQAETKFLQVPNTVERFWIDRERGEKLRTLLADQGEIEVQLESRMPWKKDDAANVLGWIEGSDPVMKKKIVVINAYYDAMSVVPAQAPGAEMACGIVALMRLAEYFQAHPPKYTVLFLASSAHHLGFRGICDFLNRHSRKEEHFAALMTEPIDIDLFIGLDLSSQTDEIGVSTQTAGFGVNTAVNYFSTRFFATFSKSFVRYATAIAEGMGVSSKDVMVDGINPKGGMTWDMYIPGENIKSDSEVVLYAGTPALSLTTVNDARFRVDTPLDRAEYVNYANLTKQIRVLAGMLDISFNSEEFLPDYKLDPIDRMRGLKGYVRTFPRRSITPDKSRPGAIAAMRMGLEKSIKGVRRIYYDLADENGEYYIPGVAERRVHVRAYYIDPHSGEITYAPNQGRQGKIYSGHFNMNWWITKQTVILFPCVATDFYGTVDPRYLNTLSNISVYGVGNTAPQEYGYDIGFGPDEPVGVVYTSPGEKVKIAMRAGAIGVRYLLLNAKSADTEWDARGEGFHTLSSGSLIRTPYQAARDMWMLNESRMRKLRQYSIENQRLEVLHAQAKQHLDEAETALQEKQWDAFVKHTRAGMGIESRAYPDVKTTQNDVIRGVIFFMLLVIPCAFFLERLIFTFSDIRMQIGGIGIVFVIIWIFLSQVHPAFDLSNPFVILLAFVILALAIFVISILSGRFNENIRRLRNAEVLLHEIDVGRVSASVAAFQLGIANMKKRKLRTWLTFATLVLLTFTVLSFTSIKSALEFHQLQRDTEGAYPGILIRSKFWGPLEDTAYDYARINFKDRGTVTPRSWYVATREDKKSKAVLRYGEKNSRVQGILGASPEEAQVTQIDTLLRIGRWFQPGESACILPDRVAETLGITERDVGKAYIRLFGKRLTVIGLINSEKMRLFVDLDEEQITPADFQVTEDEFITVMSQTETRERQGLERPEVETMPFEHLDPDDILIVPYALLRDVGSPLQSVAVRFHEEVDVEAEIKSFLSRLSVVLFAGIPTADGGIRVAVYSSLGNTSLQGMANLFIPILVAALIVLNTMMGSVYERFREIGIYSSVGLAPVHIAFLFIAEACVYAVLGTVGGYLLGQSVVKILLWQDALQGLTVNYSALSTVTSSMLVMLVVLLSSIYPARQASLMAVPDVTRRWKFPDPDGDRWHFEFPFTVGGKDVFGLSVFLVDYFQAHAGESLGTFYTDGARLGSVETATGQGHTIDTTIWLAPYDLGVSQQVHFEAIPTGEHNIFAMTLTIDRLSGDASSWRRVNKNFMNALRKQFLIWRTVAPEDKAQYTEKGQMMLAGATV